MHDRFAGPVVKPGAFKLGPSRRHHYVDTPDRRRRYARSDEDESGMAVDEHSSFGAPTLRCGAPTDAWADRDSFCVSDNEALSVGDDSELI